MTLRKSVRLVFCLALVSTVVEAQTGVSGPSSRFWQVTFRLQEDISDNITFNSSATEPQPDMVSRLGAGLSYTRVRERSQFLFGGQGAALIYRERTQNNRFVYGIDFSGSYEFTPRTSLSFAQQLSQNYSSNTSLLTGQGILLPLVLTRTATTTGSLSHRLSPKTTLVGDVSYRRVTFADSAFIGGFVIAGGGELRRQLNVSDSITASYALQQSTVQQGVPITTHRVDGGWNRTANARINFGFTAGVSSSKRPGDPKPRLTLNASGNLSALIGRGALTMNYGRSIRQTFGLGRTQLSDILSASFSHPIGQRFSVTNSLVYRLSRDPGGTEFRFNTWTYLVGGSYRLTQDMNAGASYSYRRLIDPTAEFVVKSNTVSFFITYGYLWQ